MVTHPRAHSSNAVVNNPAFSSRNAEVNLRRNNRNTMVNSHLCSSSSRNVMANGLMSSSRRAMVNHLRRRSHDHSNRRSAKDTRVKPARIAAKMKAAAKLHNSMEAKATGKECKTIRVEVASS